MNDRAAITSGVLSRYTKSNGRSQFEGGSSKKPSSAKDSSTFQWKSSNNQSDNESTHFFGVFKQFDTSFLFVVAIENFTQGFRRMLEFGLYIVFQHKLNLEPGEVTLLLGIMAFPWCLMIFFAIFADSVTCCGSRRKSYLIANSIVNIIALCLLMAFGVRTGKYFIMVCVIISQACMTWCDAISDALIA